MIMPTILVAGVSYPCAVCPICHAKVYPLSSLQAHTSLHTVKNFYLKDQLKKLRTYMGRMRA
jgi:hypothetical protein